ncbi:MAG: DUF4190 domain-containing protein [Clostridia bacterium]|nr:DUF4190 domain-containing protein [Clostridia bacterium]
MFCPKCGKEINDEAVVCVNCGCAVNNAKVKTASNSDGKGFAIASLICGIVSIIMFAIITGPLGIVFGAIAKNKGNTSPMATAGIVCGVIGVIGWLILMAMGVSLFSEF